MPNRPHFPRRSPFPAEGKALQNAPCREDHSGEPRFFVLEAVGADDQAAQAVPAAENRPVGYACCVSLRRVSTSTIHATQPLRPSNQPHRFRLHAVPSCVCPTTRNKTRLVEAFGGRIVNVRCARPCRAQLHHGRGVPVWCHSRLLQPRPVIDGNMRIKASSR
jgi:hypothetical protein